MILVAIGANLPFRGASPRQTCEAAAGCLARLAEPGLAGLRLAGLSPWFESAPVPPSGQPPYVNGVARLEGQAAPAALLAALQDIEARFGRVRSVANAARTLDLDIIDMNGLVRAAPDPVLPHPRAHLRAFVLAPIAALAPEWRHPASGRSAAELLAALDARDLRVL